VSTSAETAAEYVKRAEECERFATECRAESSRDLSYTLPLAGG
jgi:hypothetical protein